MYHNLWFGRNRCLYRILRRHWSDVDPSFYPKTLLTGFVTALTTPFRLIEQRITKRAVERETLQPPVIILGHWRSGTTNLHNLLLQDSQYCSVPLLSCLTPDSFLWFGGLFRLLSRGLVPKSRPMDNVPTGLDEPMSEDFGMAGISDLSHYVGYYFPRQLEETFRRTVFFEGCTPAEIERWGRDYVSLMKKVSMASGGKRLVLKNPPNMGRVPEILKLFPDARFIHIHRNPFTVHASTCKLHETFSKRFGLQRYDREELHNALLRRQRLICERYLTDRDQIPAENLIEVRHEDVVARPEEIVRDIYRKLELGDFENDVLPGLRAHVEANRNYRTNRYEFSHEEECAIRDELHGLLVEWGYDVPQMPSPAAGSGHVRPSAEPVVAQSVD